MNKLKIENILGCTTKTKYWLTNNCEMKLPLLDFTDNFFFNPAPTYITESGILVKNQVLHSLKNWKKRWLYWVFAKSRKRQYMTPRAAWWLWIQVRIGTWCLWLLLYLIVAIVYFFLSIFVLVSRVVYVMHVYNRGYQPHSIHSTHRDKGKKLQSSFLLHCEESLNHSII